MKQLNKWIGEKIKEARLAAGYRNQIAFAQEIGTRQATVSNWESGHTKPTVENLQAICKITNRPLSFFEPSFTEAKDNQIEKAVETLSKAIESVKPKPSPYDQIPKDILDSLLEASELKLELVRGLLAPIGERKAEKEKKTS